MNEMKKQTKLKNEIEEKEDLIIVKMQKEKDTSVKMFIEEMNVTHTH